MFTVGISEERGGAGGTVADLVALIAAAAEELVPGPVPGTVLAAHLLADNDSAGPLASIGAGELAVGLGTTVAASDRDGTVVLDGRTRVLGGDASTALLLPSTTPAGRCSTPMRRGSPSRSP